MTRSWDQYALTGTGRSRQGRLYTEIYVFRTRIIVSSFALTAASLAQRLKISLDLPLLSQARCNHWAKTTAARAKLLIIIIISHLYKYISFESQPCLECHVLVNTYCSHEQVILQLASVTWVSRLFCKGYPAGIQRISIDLHIFCKGYLQKFMGFLAVHTCVARGTPQEFFEFLLQEVSLGIHSIAIDSQLFCKGYPSGVHQISIDWPLFCKGSPLGIHHISIHLHTFCKGYPLGIQSISIDSNIFCKGYP